MADNFLKSVVRYYTEGAPGRPRLHDVVFVTPNKRSAMFLKRYVTRSMTRAARMPRLATLRSLTDRLAGRPQAARTRLIFMLYDAYRRVMAAHGRGEAVREFDSFVFWGDMMLGDFDEIDRSLVDAGKIFKNLKDVKDIQSDYLEPEIKELVHRVFGESRLTADYGEDSFWLHLADAADADSLKGRFVFLWQILGDIYNVFQSLLAAAGCSSPGSALRAAATASADREAFGDDADAHYAFVGFNDLCAAELAVFHNMARAGMASFFWDMPAAYLNSGGASDAAVARLQKLVKEFPAPDDFDRDDAADGIAAHVDVYAVPSNIGQAKFAGSILDEWIAAGAVDPADAMNTAVVVPDAGLLMPLMFSLPPQFEKINVSAGLPFRATNFAGFLQAIVGMQLRSRRLRGSLHFFYEDVAAVLNHPYMRTIDGKAATEILSDIGSNKLYNIDAAALVEKYPDFGVIFRTTGGGEGTVDGTCRYLLDLIDWLCVEIDRVTGDGEPEPEKKRRESFEVKLLENFRRETVAIADLAVAYGVAFNDRTFLRLFERVLSRETIPMEGNPLYGLQVLGVLETRALDFDNVIILSMNEGMYPRRQYTRTMIPASLRAAYGLPDLDSIEATYAYCFFRLLARARRVALLFDSRAGGLGRGEMSRYISRLEYLSDNVDLQRRSVAMTGTSVGKRLIEVEKTDAVTAHLDAFRPGGAANLSASALKEYKKCPLAFYIKYVRGMRGSDNMVDYLTAAEMGTLIHNSIQRVFLTLKDRRIHAADLAALLDPDCHIIDDAVLAVILANKRYNRYGGDLDMLPTEAKIAWKNFSDLVRADITAEAARYCADGDWFEFERNEYPVNEPWKVSDTLTVNWKMSIDRVDHTSDGRYRFVDFKSGSDDIAAAGIDALMAYNHHTEGIFQLLAYAETFRAIREPEARIVPVIHQSAKLLAKPEIGPISIGGKPVDVYDGELAEEFGARLRALVAEIFDPSVPFTQTENSDDCKYCNFKEICGRIATDKF